MIYYTVYKITNNINGKFYIGKHITENLDDDYMGSGRLIRRAIEKYGSENFSKEIIDIANDEKSLNDLEKKYIDCTDENSYNLSEGGDGGASVAKYGTRFTGKQHTEASRKKIGEASLGRKHTPETIDLIRRKNIENKTRGPKVSAALKGIKRSAETKKRISISQKLANQSLETRRKKSESAKKRPKRVLSAETKRKISEGLKNRGHSPNGKAVALHASMTQFDSGVTYQLVD